MEPAPGALRGRFPWPAALIAVVLAALTRSPALVVVAVASLVGWAASEITARLALRALDIDVSVAPSRAVAGEQVTVTIVVTNRKPLPLPWLEVRLALPEGVEPLPSDTDEPGPPRPFVDAAVVPRARERITLRYAVRVPRRGAYALGPLRLRSGDWLGFLSDERIVRVDAAIVVYPARLAVRDRHRPSLRPLAETATRRGLLPDPLRFRGVRPHRTGDARKEIHWKLSARLGELQTKLYEPATSLDAVFLVNVASYDQYWILADPDAVELVVAATTELVRLAARAGRQVGLVTNGLDNITHERPRSALGRGPRSLVRSLEILARLGPYAFAAPEVTFLRERGRLPWGATLVVVTPRLGPRLAAAAVALRRAHHRVLVTTVTEPSADVARQMRGNDVSVASLLAGAEHAPSAG